MTGVSALIADGHHRHAACLLLGEEQPGGPWARTRALLMDQNEHPLRLTAIHRVVLGIEAGKAVRAAADLMRIRPLAEGPGDHCPAKSFLPPPAGRGPAPIPILWHGTRRWKAARRHGALSRPPPRTVFCWDEPGVSRIFPAPFDTYTMRPPPSAPRLRTGVALPLPAPAEETVRRLAASGVPTPRRTTSFGPKPAAGLAMRVLETPGPPSPVRARVRPVFVPVRPSVSGGSCARVRPGGGRSPWRAA